MKRNPRHFLHSLLIGISLFWMMSCRGHVPEFRAPKILLLNSYHYGYRASDKMTVEIYQRIYTAFPQADLRTEYLDSRRYPGQAMHENLLQFLLQKYDADMFDVIVTCDDYALEFVIALKQFRWQSVPVVFFGVNAYSVDAVDGSPWYTGIVESADIESNVRLMHHLHPDADTLYIINDKPLTRESVDAGENPFPDQSSGFHTVYLNGSELSLDELLEILENSSDNSLVLYQSWLRDRTGSIYSHRQVIPLISEHSARPVYGFSETFLGLGIIGGKMPPAAIQAEAAAGRVIRILQGESPEDLPSYTDSDCIYMFDYLQLKRFGISRRDLPEGRLLVNEPFSFYRTHKSVMIIALCVLVFQTMLIVYLLLNRYWRMRIEKAFENERRMLTALMDNMPDYIYFKDKYSRFIANNKAHLGLFGVSDQKATLGKTNFDFFPLDHAEETLEDEKEILRSGKPLVNKIENISDMKGRPAWVSTTKVPVKDENGEVTAIIGISRDITDRMLSAEKLRASLEEKELLLKEIHHRVKNNLQVISSLLNLQSSTIQDPDTLNVLKESQDRVRSMALIHENLYRGQDLAYLDVKDYIEVLVKGLRRSYQGAQSGVRFDLQVDDRIPIGIDRAVPCGLVINELISNALKHAFPMNMTQENPQVCLKMSLNDKQVHLSIEDNGVGIPQDFDVETVNSLGLKLVRILIKEQLEGQISFLKNQGTMIRIVFPLDQTLQ